jgi:hypothetical protein
LSGAQFALNAERAEAFQKKTIDPPIHTDPSEVSSGAELAVSSQTVFFRTQFSIESSRCLMDVLHAVGIGGYSGKKKIIKINYSK